MKRLKSLDRIEQTTVRGGVIKFDEKGFATEFVDAEGNDLGQIPESILRAFEQNPSFKIVETESKLKKFKKVTPKVESEDDSDNLWDDSEDEEKESEEKKVKKVTGVAKKKKVSRKKKTKKKIEVD